MKESFELAEAVHVIAEAVENGGEFTMYPMGTSMLPTIRPGKDAVRLVEARELKKGDVVLYKRQNGRFVLHRILKLGDGEGLVLCGDNQSVLERSVAPESVLFLVASYEKNGKTVERGSLLFRFEWRYARALMLVKLPIRRLKSAFCRKNA